MTPLRDSYDRWSDVPYNLRRVTEHVIFWSETLTYEAWRGALWTGRKAKFKQTTEDGFVVTVSVRRA